MTALSYDEGLQRLREYISGITDRPLDEVPAAAHLYLDLDLDSLQVCGCMLLLEELSDVESPVEDVFAMTALLRSGDTGWDSYRTIINAFMAEPLEFLEFSQFISERHSQIEAKAKAHDVEPYTVGFAVICALEHINRFQQRASGNDPPLK
jgi:acyl carrier protein